MIRIFWIINSRLIKGFSVTIYPFFLSSKFEKCYQDRQSTQQSNVLLACMYSCFDIYIKGKKKSMHEKKRTESMVSSFQLQYSFLCSIQKRWVHLNFVSEINWNQNSIHRYMKFVYAIYYVDVQYQKEKKKLLLCNFFGASNFLTVLHRKSYPKRSLLLLHKVGGWQPVLAFGISKRYCTYEVFNIKVRVQTANVLAVIITALFQHSFAILHSFNFQGSC